MKRNIALILILALTACLCIGCGEKKKQDAPGATPDASVYDTLLQKTNYTVDNTALDEKGALTVATIGDGKMDNAQLQIYYWTSVYNFLNRYGAYGAVDTTKDLQEQAFNDTMNYQQYFLDAALKTWEETQVLCFLAKENGYQLPEELQAELALLPQQLQEMLGEDYATVEEMLRDQLFPGITEEGYLKYVNDYYIGYNYLLSLEESFAPTDADIEAYYEQHREGYEENGIFMTDMKANVRHILLEPEDTTSQEAWEVCLENAQALLEQWKQGEATEDSFAALANEHTADVGSSTNGGLYTDVTPSTNFVPSFLYWTINPNRQTGDTDIVQSDYGYHIMYYVSGEPMEGESSWKQVAKSDIITENTQAIINAGYEKWPLEINAENIALGYINLAG